MPSKKVISIFIISAALVVSIIIIFQPSAPKNNLTKNAGSLTSGPQTQLNPNWEKDLNNLSSLPVDAQEASSSETLTDKFSRSFMANYLALKQSGSYNSNTAAELVQKSATFLEPNQTSAYSLKDIVINADNSKTAVEKYGNDLGHALKINRPKELKNEITVFGTMMRDKDKNKVLELQNIAAVYQNTAVSLGKITVPSNFADNHLKMLNALTSLANSVSDMSQGLTDPLKALQAMVLYKKNIEVIIKLRKDVGASILKAGANYKQGSDGYFFFFGI